MDYIGRNVYMRLSTDLYIVKDSTAQSLMEDTAGKDVSSSDILESIGKKSEYMASGRVFTCQDVMTGLGESGNALVYVIEKGEPLQVGAEEETAGIRPVGYALIKDGYLEEYLDTGVTEGAGIVMGHTKSGMLTVDAENHGTITLKIIDMKTEYEPIYKNKDTASVTVKVKVKLNVEESAEGLNYINEDFREKIESAAAEEIRQTAVLAIEKSQALGTDFCGIGDAVYIREPHKFRKTHEKWQDIFKDIQIGLEVETELQRTYDMENSLNFTGDE